MAIDLRQKKISFLTVPFSYVALNYSDLVSNVPTAASGALAYCYESQGTAWLPSTLGGTYYPNGAYVFNGTSWISDRNALSNEFSNVINDIDNIEIILDTHTAQLVTLQSDINNLFTNKLDKSTYSGNAQTLKNDIDTKAPLSHTHTIAQVTGLQTALDGKVDKVVGKGLSTEDFTTAEKTKLSNISGTNTGDETTATIQAKRPLKTIEGQSLEGSGNIDLTKSDVGLSNVDNTSDLNKPISTATQTALNGKANTSHTHTISDVTGLQTALDGKVDKIVGKGLSTEDFTTAEKTKLSNISGTNTGDETTATIQAKRPLKTIEGQSLEGSGNIDLNKSDVGLSNVDNTSDLNKPISTATQTALNGKANTSHTHLISDVTGLQTSLDGKANAIHTHAIYDITGLQTALDNEKEVFNYYNSDVVLSLPNSTTVIDNRIFNYVFSNCQITIKTLGLDTINGKTEISFKRGTGNVQIVKKENNVYLII